MPENIEAVSFYRESIDDQWTLGPMGGHIGIRNEAIESAMNMNGVAHDDRGWLFKDLRVIGKTIAAELAAERKKEQEKNAKT